MIKIYPTPKSKNPMQFTLDIDGYIQNFNQPTRLANKLKEYTEMGVKVEKDEGYELFKDKYARYTMANSSIPLLAWDEDPWAATRPRLN